ncbi:PhzF family phenazine biosynthesis protein [Vibrio ostreicida]|uniref:PhzF family phenazine biosynthesis protein n=1 Tax=Vibrio ostreicida TaxID=526588 RepID=A0ABT8BV67_9VIBR|nr:PhzF family phenazine biosynthesis protein [Vibrio ostreicida]MDN3610274.1 PhzF family phenazine biosynthesis protein [Vibrio ostreicida]NPD07711.1 PhzF family phenazine biosynthesis protein [Vibrio ostreicida]
MEVEIYQVDAFSNEVFKGNPAGVCVVSSPLTDAQMLAIAGEMAVSETAFLHLPDMNLRWFTPEVEVALCGHGTLAVAHVLKQQQKIALGESVTFSTLSGPLSVEIRHSSYHLNFPLPKLETGLPLPLDKIQALGLCREAVISYCRFDNKDLFELDNEQRVYELRPDFSALTQLAGRGILVTASSDRADIDVISRYFAPWVGVNEDPVTGSAHCALGQYWGAKLDQSQLRAYQASARGGFIDVEVLDNDRVILSGQAVTALQGVLTLPPL